MKFLSFDQQIMTVQADQQMARQCYVDSLKVVTIGSLKNIEDNVSVNVELDPCNTLSRSKNYNTYNSSTMDTRINEEKTAFMMEGPNYYYQVMPFGLKNTGVTCQDPVYCFSKVLQEIKHILREENTHVGMLSKLAIAKTSQHQIVLHRTVKSPTINEFGVLIRETVNREWMIPIWDYLKNENTLKDKVEAAKIKRRESRYLIDTKELYKRGFSMPLLKCLTKSQATYVMDEIHKGICGFHLRGCMMISRVLRASYYWLTMLGMPST
ncbi:hypothetical protein CR513_61322, partial [Mucuna pruriens]